MDGTLVGFAIPSATPYHRNVGYLGVVPELRGCRYVDDILCEITRFHAADGANRITATTDVPNTSHGRGVQAGELPSDRGQDGVRGPRRADPSVNRRFAAVVPARAFLSSLSDGVRG